MFEGLKVAHLLGVQALEVQLDSLVVVKILTEDGVGSSVAWTLLREIRKLLQLPWTVRITHIERQIGLRMC